jgi:hypothetical protein
MLAWCSAAKWCCCCCCCCCLVQAGRPQQTIAADGFGPDMGGRPLLQCSGLPAACHGCHDGCPSLPSAATPSRGTFHHPWILRTSEAFSHTHTLPARKKKKTKKTGAGSWPWRFPPCPCRVPDALARRPQHNEPGVANLGPNGRHPALLLTMGKPAVERRSETRDWRSELSCCYRTHGGPLVVPCRDSVMLSCHPQPRLLDHPLIPGVGALTPCDGPRVTGGGPASGR